MKALGGSIWIAVLVGLFGVHDAAAQQSVELCNVVCLSARAREALVARQFTDAVPDGVSASGIDGLYWYESSLIAVQNARGLERVMRYRLHERGDSIVGAEVLERSQQFLRVPTTGAILGSRFYYIANSQAERLDSDNRLAAPARGVSAEVSSAGN